MTKRFPDPDSGGLVDDGQEDGQPLSARARSIEHAPMPDWAVPYLTAAQLALPPVTRWITLFYLRQGLEVSHTAVVQHLALSVAFKGQHADKKAWHSERVIGEKVNLARQTVNKVMGQLAAEGWIVRERRPGFSSTCWPSWPSSDCLADVAGPERCLATAKTGKLCTRPAGWGTSTPGTGPCKIHRDVQVLEVDASGAGEPVAGPLDAANRTGEGVQPLDTLSGVEETEGCLLVGHPVVQPEDRGLSDQATPLVQSLDTSGEGVTKGSGEEGVHGGVGRSGAELEVPQPRRPAPMIDTTNSQDSSTSRGSAKTSAAATGGAHLWEGTAALAALTARHPCPPAVAAAMLDEINREHGPVSDWPRFLAVFSPADLAAWNARARPTPVPSSVHEVLAAQRLLADLGDEAGQDDVDDGQGQDDAEPAPGPGAEARAALRASKGWIRGSVRTTG